MEQYPAHDMQFKTQKCISKEENGLCNNVFLEIQEDTCHAFVLTFRCLLGNWKLDYASSHFLLMP